MHEKKTYPKQLYYYLLSQYNKDSIYNTVDLCKYFQKDYLKLFIFWSNTIGLNKDMLIGL